MGWLLHNAGNIQWFPAAAKYRLNQITVHLANELKRYLLGAHRFTLTMIRTAAEVFIHHCDNHAERPLIALGLTLRKRVKVPNFGRGEEHGRGIRAGSDTGSTADACSRVKRSIRSFLWDQD
jgi:hypothetical protein